MRAGRKLVMDGSVNCGSESDDGWRKAQVEGTLGVK